MCMYVGGGVLLKCFISQGPLTSHNSSLPLLLGMLSSLWSVVPAPRAKKGVGRGEAEHCGMPEDQQPHIATPCWRVLKIRQNCSPQPIGRLSRDGCLKQQKWDVWSPYN